MVTFRPTNTIKLGLNVQATATTTTAPGINTFAVTASTTDPTGSFTRGLAYSPVNWGTKSYPFESAYSWSTSTLSGLTITGGWYISSRDPTDSNSHQAWGYGPNGAYALSAASSGSAKRQTMSTTTGGGSGGVTAASCYEAGTLAACPGGVGVYNGASCGTGCDSCHVGCCIIGYCPPVKRDQPGKRQTGGLNTTRNKYFVWPTAAPDVLPTLGGFDAQAHQTSFPQAQCFF